MLFKRSSQKNASFALIKKLGLLFIICAFLCCITVLTACGNLIDETIDESSPDDSTIEEYPPDDPTNDILRVLVLQSDSSDDAQMVDTILQERYGSDYDTAVFRTLLSEMKDITLEELRNWDEVILVNISNADLQSMAEGFDVKLDTYVSEYGGGLLTVGGNKIVNDQTVANTYVREDMLGSLYQSMLPIQAEAYTLPIAVMIVLDSSSSMIARTSSGQTLMQLAKEGIVACINALNDRDYAGIVTFSDRLDVAIELTPIAQKERIIDALSYIQPDGGTVYTAAIEKASHMLQDLCAEVASKHIIFVTDGEPYEIRNPISLYNTIEYYYDEAGIRMSVLAINPSMAGDDLCANMARSGGNGGYSKVSNANGDFSEIPGMMRDFIVATEITGMNYKEFTPKAKKADSSIFDGINIEDIPNLYGFYATQPKSDADTVLVGDYNVPIYARHKYGKGKVGSIMIDLIGSESSWSRDFMNDETGRQIIWNIICELLPSKDEKPRDIIIEADSQSNISTINIMLSDVTGCCFIIPTKDYDKIQFEVAGIKFDVYTNALKEVGMYNNYIQKQVGGYCNVI